MIHTDNETLKHNGWNSLGHFHVILYKQSKENIVTDVLSRMYILISTIDAKLLGFKHIKEFYHLNHNFC